MERSRAKKNCGALSGMLLPVRASRAFLEQPPQGFADVSLMSPRAALFVAGPDAVPRLVVLD